MNLSNREEIIASLQQAMQPNPEAQQAQQAMQQMQMAKEKAILDYTTAQTQEVITRIQQNQVETQLLPVDSETKRYAAVMKGMGQDPTEAEFARRAQIAELALKQREIETKEDIVEMQMRGTNGNETRTG
jgi:Tfp pilus assembly protein PilV